MKRQCITGLIGISTLLLASHPTIVQAQITPDATFGAESSRLTPNVLIQGGNADRIDGGATRGSNLFHSFSQFNVADGQRLYFSSPTGVQNILTRVTGGRSDILGTLGVNGAANLFLLNPNGIVFGPNAQLDGGGSFIGTTASGVQFGNQGAFTVNQSDAPPLLTIQPSALIFNQISAQAEIINSARRSGLTVKNGNSVALIGGNVKFDGGILQASGGAIEIGGLAAPGTIGLALNGKDLSLNFPENISKSDVLLTNGASVRSAGGSGKGIRINANQINVQASQLVSSIRKEQGASGTQAGDIVLNSSGKINLDQRSLIGSIIFEDAIGNGGNILLTAIDEISLKQESTIASISQKNAVGNSGSIVIQGKSLNVRDGSALTTSHLGIGNSGNIVIRVSDSVVFDGTTKPRKVLQGELIIPSLAFTSRQGGSGKVGDILITASSLSLTNGGALSSSFSEGTGSAGNIVINAKDSVLIDGTTRQVSKLLINGIFIEGPLPSSITSEIGQKTISNASPGNIQILTGTLVVSKGGRISTASVGKADSGNIKIVASGKVQISDSSPQYPLYRSRLITSATESNGGSLQIKANSLLILDGASLETGSEGGNGGDILIETQDNVILKGQNRIDADLGGAITSGILTNKPEKKGGDIRIITGSLLMDQGNQITASAFGSGQGGNIVVEARDRVDLDGTDRNLNGTAIVSNLTTLPGSIAPNPGKSKGGNIRITTDSLSLTNGAVVSARAAVPGDAGNVKIKARSVINLDGRSPSGVSSRIVTSVLPSGSGQGGNLEIETGQLLLNQGGAISASNSGQGSAGNIQIISDLLRLDNSSSVRSNSESGRGGNINLDVKDNILLRRSSFITATAGSNQRSGNGGNITITAPLLVAVPRENSDIFANAFTGNGGIINIQTNGLFGIAPSPKLTPLSDITASSAQGVQGTVTITQPDVRPEQGLNELPVNLLNGNQLSQSCANNRADKPAGSFIITGRGSLPTSPLDPLADNPNLPRLAELQPNDRSIANTASPIIAQTPTIVEAQGWQKTRDGKVILLAQPIVMPATIAMSGTAGASNGFACVLAHGK